MYSTIYSVFALEKYGDKRLHAIEQDRLRRDLEALKETLSGIHCNYLSMHGQLVLVWKEPGNFPDNGLL